LLKIPGYFPKTEGPAWENRKFWDGLDPLLVFFRFNTPIPTAKKAKTPKINPSENSVQDFFGKHTFWTDYVFLETKNRKKTRKHAILTQVHPVAMMGWVFFLRNSSQIAQK